MKLTKKFIVSIAVVGTLAVVALFNVASYNHSSSSTFLASDNEDGEVTTLFNSFVSEHRRNFLTRDEYNARLKIFKTNYKIVTEHNAGNSTF